MFNIGDKIVYPSQGVGIIDTIEKKEFLGKIQDYYNIILMHNSLKVMLPANRMDISHIRLISNPNELDCILDNITALSENTKELDNSNCKERIAANSLKIKSGSLTDYFEVIYNLTKTNKKNPLNSSEKQMLNNTKKILIDEISLIKDIPNSEATDLLNNSLSLI